MTGLLLALLVPNAVAQLFITNTPIFQFAVFYNPVLEINPGGAFTISGRVHCNTNMYCTGDSSGSPLTFLNRVDCSGTETNNPSPLDPQNYGNRTGNVVFSGGSPMAHSDTLNLPLGTSTSNYTYAPIESLLQLPPPAYALGTAAAYTANGSVYFANKADFIITNDVATGTNITVLYQNQYSGLGPSWVFPVLPDAIGNIVTNIIVVTNGTFPKYYVTNFVYITNYYYSYVTNATFYDYREGKTVNALQIDVSRLGAWLSNTNPIRGGWQYELMNTADEVQVISSIYVYNSIVPTPSTLPAVRLVNGAQLPTNSVFVFPPYYYPASGLTIATAQPIYVKGNYNVTVNWQNFAYTLGSTTNGYTLPAALIGDAVTLLSSNFVDTATPGTEDPTPTETAITLNAACFEGVVPSNGSYYSGGLENFLRLLENWSSKTVNYNGSIVVMFPSTYATNHWGGSYYGAPTRAWGFDTTFLDISKLPPLTPEVVDNGTNPPTIITQPQSQTVTEGSSVTLFFAFVSSSPLGYQWKFNGTNISSATNFSLILTNVQYSQAGNYAVLITNLYGSTLSSNAVLTVLVPPSITTQPTGCTNVAGATENFNVMANGTAPLIYQWLSNGTNLVDATNATLTLNNITLNQAGNYSVTVTNIAGSVTSSNAVLAVYATAAATLNGCSFSCVNGLEFQVAGVPGFNYAVQESTNLIDWVSLITNTSPFCFADTNAANFPQQFYRTLYMP